MGDSKTAGIVTSVGAAVVALVSVFSDQIGALVAAHPTVTVWVGLVSTVVAALSKAITAPKA